MDEQQTRTFNPQDHLMQLRSKDGSKDYLPVQWRLVWFREMCPHGTIDTEELEVDLDREMEEEAYAWNNETRRSEKVVKKARGYARYKAIVTDGKGGRATGTKSEKAVSFPDYIEKAECVPLHSEILTRDGFKAYDQLTIGEHVLAYDHLRNICVWTPLQRVVVYEDAPVVRLHGQHFEVLCTPDHSWATYTKQVTDGRTYQYRNLVKAYKLRKHHRIVLAAPGPSGTHPLTLRDAAILGWLVTDGSIQRIGESVRSYICQSKLANIPVIRELVGGLATETVLSASSRTFPSGKTYECLPQHRFTFSASETRRILEVAGITCTEDLPGMIPQYSHGARQAMLIAMMLADGDERGYFGKKRKPGVMEAWQILATLEGFALGAMHESSVGEVPVQRLKKRTMVCASELQMESAGTMDVWCPTTNYGTWVMRQNGRVMITGNTGAIGRALAALGYGTQFTGDEFDERHRIVDAPVTRPVNEAAASGNGQAARNEAPADRPAPVQPAAPESNGSNGRKPGDSMKSATATRTNGKTAENGRSATATDEKESETPATEQQVASICKLCQHLGKPEPENQETMTYLNAKELIAQLSLEYRQSRQAEQSAQPASTEKQARPEPISTGMATDQQKDEIRDLCQKLGREGVPVNLDRMSFDNATNYITGLNARLLDKQNKAS